MWPRQARARSAGAGIRGVAAATPARRFCRLLAVLALAGCHARPIGPPPVDGRTATGIAYEVHGRGEPLVLIHGAFLDRRQWRPQAPLGREHALVTYDTRWHGRSAGATAAFSAADDARDVLDDTGLPAAVLVGLSNGARIAINAALEHPERVRALVLVSPDIDGFVPRERAPFWTGLLEALGRKDFEAAATRLAQSPIMEVGPSDSAWVASMVRDHARVFRGDPALERRTQPAAIERLQTLRVPVLVVTGSADLPDIQRAAREIADRVPGARLEVIPEAKHLLTITHAPRFNRLLADFLDRNAL